MDKEQPKKKQRRYLVLECGSVFDTNSGGIEYIGKSFDMQDELKKDERESDEE